MKSVILTSKNNASLDILPAGEVPANPAELVACGKIDNVVEILKNQYDYVVIDSTSLDNDADAIYINKVADYTLYVVRADVTTKKNVEAIDQLAENGRLKNINVAVNAMDQGNFKVAHAYYRKAAMYGGLTGKEWMRRILAPIYNLVRKL